MNELRPQIDSSEKGDLASQLSAITESGALKVRTEVPQETPISVAANDDKVRGGRGSRMAPGSLTSTLQEIRKEEGRIKYEEEDELEQINKGVKELNAAHLIFASNIKTLQNKLSKNPPPAEEKRLNIMLSMAKEQMGAIEKILPINTERKSYDSDALKTGISRYKEYEDARRKQMLAEINQLQGKVSEQEVMAVRRKANYLYGEIFELTKNEREKSLQERKALNADTTNSTIMPENPQTLTQPQETLATPESVVPQTPKLNQEALDLLHNAGGLPMFLTSNLKRIAEENGVSVSDTDTKNQIIEKLQALDNGEVVAPQVATVTESAPAEPTITIEPAQGAENSLQDEALAILENEGGLVPEETPEPEVAKEITVENIIDVLTPEEVIVGKPLEGQEGAFAKFELISEEVKAGLNAEQLALTKVLEGNFTKINIEVEERGIKARAVEHIRNVSKTLNKFPPRYSLAVTAGLIATGAIIGSTSVTPLVIAGVAMRFVGGFRIFSEVDETLKKQAEAKSGSPRTEAESNRHFILAGSLAVCIAALLPEVIRDSVINPVIDYVQNLHDPINGGALFHTEAPVATAVSPENMAVAGSFIEIAKPGDTVWKMAEHQLETQMGEKFTSLSPEQQTYIIDAVKDRIEQNPDAFGVADINNIEVGKGIDFTNALNDKEFIANTLAHAQGLNPEEIANIKNYEGSAVPEAEARVLTFEEVSALANGEVKSFDVLPTAEAVPVGAEGIPTAEAVPVGILEPSPVSEAIAHPDAHIKVGNIEGTFKYAPDGKVVGFPYTGEITAPETLEAKKLLNQGWAGIVSSNPTGLGDLNSTKVLNRANVIFQYEQVLNYLEQHGGRMTPEADFLRDEISRTITDTEKIYGDVFKDIGGTSEVVSAIPMEEPTTMPQEINPGNPEVATSASKYVHDYINNMFGTKGIFGFGAVDGMKTPNWLDFANRPVAEIMQAQPNPTPSSAGLDVGIKNNDALAKIQQYLKVAIDETGVQPARGETTEKFLNRAAMSTLEKIK